MLIRIAGVTASGSLLPRLAGGIAPVALRLALGRLGGVADHLLDRLAALAGLTLDLLDRFARGALLGFLGLLRLALGLAPLAGGRNRRALFPPLDHLRVVRTRPRLEFLQRLLPRLGGPGEPLLHVVVLEASHCILSRVLRRNDGLILGSPRLGRHPARRD